MEMDPLMEYSFVPIDGSIWWGIHLMDPIYGSMERSNDGSIDGVSIPWIPLYDGSIDRAKQIGLYKPIKKYLLKQSKQQIIKFYFILLCSLPSGSIPW